MSLGEIRALLELRENPTQDCTEVNAMLDMHVQHVEERIEVLLQLKQHLVVLREKCGGARSMEACGILQGLADRSCHTDGRQDS